MEFCINSKHNSRLAAEMLFDIYLYAMHACNEISDTACICGVGKLCIHLKTYRNSTPESHQMLSNYKFQNFDRQHLSEQTLATSYA